MPQLLLLRHAKSSWASPAVSDHDRVLTERGTKNAAGVGAFLAAEGLKPDLILTSSATRARQTVDCLLGALAPAPQVQTLEALYNASLTALLETVRKMCAGAEILLVVGHNPSIGQATAHLSAGRAANTLGTKYPTATLAHFDTGAVSLAHLAPPMELVSLRTPRDQGRTTQGLRV